MTNPSTSDRRRPRGRTGSMTLRALVHAVDAAALLIGWIALLAILKSVDSSLLPANGVTSAVAVVVAGILALRATGTHERRIARVRSLELAGTTKAAMAPAAMVVLLVEQPSIRATALLAAVGAVIWVLLLAGGRALLGEWVRGNRARGHLRTPVLVVGTGRAAETAEFLRRHPHLGYSVADVVELLPDDPNALDSLLNLSASLGATGVVISDPGDPIVAPLLPGLTSAGTHVHVATGVQGLDLRGAITSSMAGELFLDFAPRVLPSWEAAAIRTLDVAIAGIVLTLTAPISAVVALLIKRTDGGPALYVHDRVGLGGNPFPMIKFRSMREGAPAPVSKGDDGREGPLTKIAGDPRITPIGKLIRATSIDELPQLVNVLRGDMSIVGPRPALQSEVDQFDTVLKRRTEVRPGLTGLWQVEARDLPSFELYRRFDLLYVDNLSLTLYVTVLLRTVTALIGQTLRSLMNGSEQTLTVEEAPAIIVLPGESQATNLPAPSVVSVNAESGR